MNFSPDEVIELFNQALERPLAERAACLDEACPGDDILRGQVESLLNAHASAGDFLANAVSLVRSDEPIGEISGGRVGRYKLIEQIGEGGCGVVFLAEQEKPVRRQVALKVVKPGTDTRSVIARFESERQALAMMDHPHIARVFDAGATAEGRPYFVMELVRGEKITDYCDHRGMTVEERLALFVNVCQAVQHAHQKGIIHRDLKPSNILVSTTGEGMPLPKVIDFGIAKATCGQQLTERPFFTAMEVLIGTPAYMSPEQADLRSRDVDTRADIYSLGVLLYELLTGALPFLVREVHEAGLDEVRRDILEKQPERPSARLKGLSAGELGETSRRRQTDASRLIRQVRGDLDWIVMQALEKDRSRRYPTANALALDVQRHLANEPVAARPPSTLYRVGKLVARNRLLVGSASMIGILLVGSLAAMSVLLARERSAHAQAETEKHTARVEADKSTKANGVLSEMLESVAPAVAMGQDTTILQEFLERTDRKIGSDLKNQPEVEAKLRLMLGNSYNDIGDIASSEKSFRRALEIQQAATPPNRLDIASAMSPLGYILMLREEYQEAEHFLERACGMFEELGSGYEKKHIKTTEYLALLRSRQGRHDEAEVLLRYALTWHERVHGPDHLESIFAMARLALVYHAASKFPEAERLYREVLKKEKSAVGEQHPMLALTLENLATVTASQGKGEDEERFLSEAVALYCQRFYPGHPRRLGTTLRLAELHRKSADFARAEPLYREVITNGRSSDGKTHPTVIRALEGIGKIMRSRGMGAEQVDLLNRILTPAFMRTPECVPVLAMRAESLARSGRWRDAVSDATRLVELEPEKHGHYHMLAPLLVAADDEVAYRELRPVILARFAETGDARAADQMAKDCLIRGGLDDLAAVNRMADVALRNGQGDIALPFFQAGKALAEYRRGNFRVADEFSGKVGSKFVEAEVEALAVRAMALHRMERKEEARTLLARGTALFEEKLPKVGSGDLGGNWRDWIIAGELLGEARALLGDDPE
jgi:eukaryotic-like serine/threonine-protein kinase